MARRGLASAVAVAALLGTASAADAATSNLALPAGSEGADPIGQGKTFVYGITVTNSGPDAAANTVLTAVLGQPNLSPAGFMQNSGPAFNLAFNGTDTFAATIASLASGATATFNVSATAAFEGTGNVTFTAASNSTDPDPSNNSRSETTTITGLVATPSPLAFSSQPLGLLSGPQAVTVTNSTASTQTISRPRVGGTHGFDFVPAADTCEGQLLTGSTCTTDVRFAPSGLGAREGTLTYPENSAAILSPVVGLSGTGSDGPVGPIGPTGAEGPQGPAGPPGPQGTTLTRLVLVPFETRIRKPAGRRVKLRYVSTDKANVTLAVLKGEKRVARVRGTAKLGRNALTWNGRIRKKPAKPGRYRLVLEGRAGERVAKATVRLRLR